MTHTALEQGEGILRLAPTWVPRVFCIPGKRIKLHPADLYSFGAHRGGIVGEVLVHICLATAKQVHRRRRLFPRRPERKRKLLRPWGSLRRLPGLLPLRFLRSLPWRR